MLEVPVFLYTLFYVIVASAIPLLMLNWLVRLLIKSGKKTYRSARY